MHSCCVYQYERIYTHVSVPVFVYAHCGGVMYVNKV